MLMCVDARTVVRTVYGNSEVFGVGVVLHPGLGLSALLFLIDIRSDF